MRKSPFASSATPAAGVLNCVKGAAAEQISVACTLWPALPPMPLPPPSSSPLPRTVIRPSNYTAALRPAITQICPGGLTPRAMFLLTVTLPSAFTVTFETGITPVAPSNLARE